MAVTIFMWSLKMSIDKRMDEINQEIKSLMDEYDRLKNNKTKDDFLRLLTESKDHLTVTFAIGKNLFSAYGRVQVLENNEINIIPINIWECGGQ